MFFRLNSEYADMKVTELSLNINKISGWVWGVLGAVCGKDGFLALELTLSTLPLYLCDRGKHSSSNLRYSFFPKVTKSNAEASSTTAGSSMVHRIQQCQVVINNLKQSSKNLL